MGVVVAVQSTVAVVACTAVATGLVAAPLVSCRGRLTHLLNRAGALSTSWDTTVAVTVVTAISRVAELRRCPLVTRAGHVTSLNVGSRALSTSRRTLVAVTVVATVGTAAAIHPVVDTARELTRLRRTTGASASPRATNVALVACTTVATSCSLPGVLGCCARPVAGLEVGRSTPLGIPRSTSVTEGKPTLTVVVAVGTFTRTDGVRPGTVVLTGLEVRLTAVLVTHLLTACVIGLVEGVVRTVTVGPGALCVTTRATVVLGRPHVITTRAVHTNLGHTATTTFGTHSTLVTVAVHTAQRAGTGLGVGPSIAGSITNLNRRRATTSASAGATQSTRTTGIEAGSSVRRSGQLTRVILVLVTEVAAGRSVGTTDITVTVTSARTTVRTGCQGRPLVAIGIRHTLLGCISATLITSSVAVVAVAILAAIATVGVVVAITGAGRGADLTGRAATGS